MKKFDASRRFEMIVPGPWLTLVDKWRLSQRGAPSRAEAIRRLVSSQLAAKEAQPVVDGSLGALSPETQTAIEKFRATRPYLDSPAAALEELIARGLESEQPAENVVTLGDDDIKALRAAAGDRPLPMLVSEMLDYAIRSYNARADEDIDEGDN